MNEALLVALRWGFRGCGLSPRQLYIAYISLGGTATTGEVERFFSGALTPGNHEYNILAQAINERYVELGGNHPVPYAEPHTALIGYLDVMPRLIHATPTFEVSVDAARVDVRDSEYLHMTQFVRHLIGLLAAGETGDFTSIFDMIERILVDGDAQATKLIWFGFFDDLLRPAWYVGTGCRPVDFAPWLGPRARQMPPIVTMLGSEEVLPAPLDPDGATDAHGAARQDQMTVTFVELADSLVKGFDIVEMLTTLATRCIELFGPSHAGTTLLEPTGYRHVVAPSTDEIEMLEILEVQYDQGPSSDAFHLGQPVSCDHLADAVEQWPNFTARALDLGFKSAYSFPLGLRDQVIGALNLLSKSPAALSPDDHNIVQAFTDIATISILNHRAAEDSRQLVEQLSHALKSRIAIEQAKGIVAAQLHTNVDTAFTKLRHHARSHNQRLVDLAETIIDNTMHGDQLN